MPICTVLYHKDLHLLSKNRDKNFAVNEEIVVTEDVLGVLTKGASYLSIGINRFGVAFASTAVNSPAWTRAAYSGDFAEANRIAVVDNEGLKGPTEFLTQIFSELQSPDDFLQRLSRETSNWKGYHIVISDQRGGYVLELHQNRIESRKLRPRDVVTNHFQIIPYGPSKKEDYPDSFARNDYARSLIESVNNQNDFQEIIRPRNGDRRKIIWRRPHFKTVSSAFLNIQTKQLWYTSDLGEAYRKFSFENFQRAEGRTHDSRTSIGSH